MASGSTLLVGTDALDAAIVAALRSMVDLHVVESVQDALDEMQRVRPSVVILNGSFGAVKTRDLARSLRSLVSEDVIILHVGPLPEAGGARMEVDAVLAHPLRLPEVIEVLERIGRDGGTELKITTRMPRLGR
jgi:DNA-binding response OmpR family regulator